MKIKHKLTLLALIPLLAYCFQSWRTISINIKDLQLVDIMRRNSKLIEASSSLITELQRERGKTSLHLAGAIDITQVEKQRSTTDGKNSPLIEALANGRINAATTQAAEQVHELLPSLRKRALQLSGADMRQEYGNLIARLIAAQAGAAQAPTTRGLGKIFSTIVLIESAKENSGLLRASLAALIARDKALNEEELNEIMRYRSFLEANLGSPALSGSSGLTDRINQIEASPAWSSTATAFARVVGRWSQGQFGANSQEVFETLTTLIDNIGGLVDHELSFVATKLDEISTEIKKELAAALLVFIGFLVVSVGAVIYISRSITSPLAKGVTFAEAIKSGDLSSRLKLGTRDEIGQLTAALDEMADRLESRAHSATSIAQGDLTTTIELASQKDTLGQAFCAMVDKLRVLLGEVASASTQVKIGVGEISKATQSLSAGATTQAASVQQISASMTEMSSQIKGNAENSSSAATLTRTVREEAKRGQAEMGQVLSAVAAMNESAVEVTRTIKVIDDIAFQTNLLALNAAVEAARAGKHGKGFAVVADEVRNLAGRSARAAKETEEMIQRSTSQAHASLEITKKAAALFSRIAEEIHNASDLMEGIDHASQEQAAGVSQVHRGIEQIDRATQDSCAGAEQIASNAEQLALQTNRLHELITQFKLNP